MGMNDYANDPLKNETEKKVEKEKTTEGKLKEYFFSG